MCPLTLKEMNGSQPFVYLWYCGCVFSQSGLRAVAGTPPPREAPGKLEKKEAKDAEPGNQLDMCPQCGAKYNKAEDILQLNPPPEEESKMFEAMLKRRASEPAKSKGKKRKAAAAVDPDAAEPTAKKQHASPVPSINSNIATASRAVASSLAQEEAKRKANMSEAVRSLYEPKNGTKKKETFMTRGTFTRVRVIISSSLPSVNNGCSTVRLILYGFHRYVVYLDFGHCTLFYILILFYILLL